MNPDIWNGFGDAERSLSSGTRDGAPVRVLVVERGYDVDRSDLWHAVTTPERIARWLVAEEQAHRAAVVESLSEREGSLTLPAPGGPFTLTAKADRIDRLIAGGFLLVDYKTGSLPSNREVEWGFAPQLPLEGAILRDGNFAGLAGAPAALEYWRLTGGVPVGRRCPIGGDDPNALIDSVLAKVRSLIERFDDPATPYLAEPAPQWAPRFSDYRHLERVTAGEDEE